MASDGPAKEVRHQGIAVAPGIASGPVFVHWTDDEDVPCREIDDLEISAEISRFESALIATRAELLDIQQRIATSLGAEDASIFDAHLLVVEDRTLIDEVLRNLRRDHKNVEFTFHQVAERYRKSLSEIDDEYLRERAVDVEDVTRRVIRHMLGKEAQMRVGDERPHIVVSRNLTPSDTALMDRSLVLGIGTEVGSRTSHTAIMARSMALPAIVGLKDICEQLATGDFVLIDGYSGTLIVNPGPATLREYGELESRKEEVEERLELIRDTRSTTTDGRHVALSANLDLPDELDDVLECGAEGVGLYRTEFLYLNREECPGEEEQYENYRLVAERVHPHGLIIRTLDIGGDKVVESLDLPEEANPFLGSRAVRFCLDHPEIFKTQLRAILRASVVGNVRVMYPMISGLSELRRANAMLEECKLELSERGTEFNPNIEVGIMIEVPSAAITADLLAPEVSFFSIGTNDLIQYTIAVDRVNERVAHLYEPTHPALLRMIRMVVDAAHANKIWVGVCGEIAGDLVLTPLLIGLGLDELSVGTALVPRVKKAVQSLDSQACQRLAEEALQTSNSEDILARCREVAVAHYAELID